MMVPDTRANGRTSDEDISGQSVLPSFIRAICNMVPLR